MESYKISQLPQAESITEDDLLEVSVSSDSTYDSAKATVGQIATATMTEFSYDNLSTEDKTIIGAINELISSGPSVVVEPLTVTENGTYQEAGKAYSPVTVNIKSDIEKVVSESEWWDDSYLVPITVDGNPVTLNSPLEQNAISTLLSYSPKQEGTGDPSPTNIRPITGWTGAQIHVNDSTIPVSWQSEAGTVYGGVLDATTGTLTVTHFSQFYDGDRITGATKENNLWRIYTDGSLPDSEMADVAYMNFLCNYYTSRTQYNGVNNNNNSIALNYSRIGQFIMRDDSLTSLDDIKTAYNNTPLQIVYKLRNPQTYTLTPQEIELLEGINTLSTDGDNISLTYRGEQANAPLLGMLGNAILTQNSMVESEPTEESLTEVEENVFE